MGELDVGYLGAFAAGLLSFLSPCVLPLVPPYLAFIGGVTLDQADGPGAAPAGRARVVFFAALAFVLGFSTVFVAMGATASLVGQAVSEHLDTLAMAAGVVIILFGLHFLGVLPVKLFYREARYHPATRPAGLVGAYVVGLAFAFGWTPCVGPVLATILFVAGSEQTVARGATLLLAYALGIGLPFLAASLAAGPFMAFMRRFRRWVPWVERTLGAILVLTGVFFLTGMVNEAAYWLLETFPTLGRVG